MKSGYVKFLASVWFAFVGQALFAQNANLPDGGFFFGGDVTFQSFDELNQAFDAGNLPELEGPVFYSNFGFELLFNNRIIIGGTGGSMSMLPATENNVTTSYRGGWGVGYAGYNLLRESRQLRLVPLLELGAGGGQVRVAQDYESLPQSPSFDSLFVAGGPQNISEVGHGAVILGGGLRFDVHPTAKIRFFIRAQVGYRLGITTDWFISEPDDINNSVQDPLAGVYAGLGVGWMWRKSDSDYR